MEHSVCAIIVAYNPNAEVLDRLIGIVRPSVESIVIVNNGPPFPVEADVIQNQENVGLSAALNQGIDWAGARGFSAVILFDQDSHPEPDMVPNLRQALAALQAERPNIAVVGPCLVDGRAGIVFPFVRWGFPRNKQVHPGREPVSIDFLITSGALIPFSALRAIGPMDASLFIDNIDTEWCARAISKGYRIYGIPDARMRHEIGDNIVVFRAFGWERPLFVHSPTRLYYIMRNRILLYSMPHVSWTWKSQDLWKIPFRLVLFATLIPGRWKNVTHMLAGLFHGLTGRRGEMPSGK
jgi:rhamnosyltransferase